MRGANWEQVPGLKLQASDFKQVLRAKCREFEFFGFLRPATCDLRPEACDLQSSRNSEE